jgi:hypothetical protein
MLIVFIGAETCTLHASPYALVFSRPSSRLINGSVGFHARCGRKLLPVKSLVTTRGWSPTLAPMVARLVNNEKSVLNVSDVGERALAELAEVRAQTERAAETARHIRNRIEELLRRRREMKYDR